MNRSEFLQTSLSGAAAARGERPLSVSLDEEMLVAETILQVGDTP